MTYQPGEQPYTQPQDPWSGTQGMASAPTDPMPATPAERNLQGMPAAPAQQGQPAFAQPVRGQFAPGVAAPGVWVQETVAHGDPYRSGGRGGLYVLVVLLVVVLGGAGGFGAWWAITNYAGGPGDPLPSTPATDGSASPTAAPTETPVVERVFDQLVVGTCMINRGTGAEPDMQIVACDWPGDLEIVQVIGVQRGAAIEESDGGALDGDSATAFCGDLAGFDLYYAWDHPTSDDRDFLACLTKSVTAS